MIKELKDVLVGKELKEEEYESDLNFILSELGLELNSIDFDYDRIYNKDYASNKDWDLNYIGSIEKEYYEDNETEMIRIIDIF